MDDIRFCVLSGMCREDKIEERTGGRLVVKTNLESKCTEPADTSG